jgi:hypothetical protein
MFCVVTKVMNKTYGQEGCTNQLSFLALEKLKHEFKKKKEKKNFS